ncbi:MAG TPA: general secretion pathway protein GspB [Wenzhouxiangella sp.]|nr:general secretion pathway protein GspB [Wenzhouxiangella sp.]
MSFILDALRKSDARRQQSGTPGLNSPEPSQPPRRRRRRILPWLGAALLVVAVAAAGIHFLQPKWLTDRQQAVNDQPQPASPQESEASGASKADPGGSEQLARTEPVPPSASDKSREQSDDQTTESPAPATRRDRRQPIPADPDRVVRREPSERESRPVPAGQATEELERRIAAEEALRRRAQAAETREQARRPEQRETGVSRRADTAGSSDAGTKKEPKPLNEGVSEYLRVWELPLSVRRNLPELSLTIHVFSPDPAKRFVLINGERYGPGDTIGEVDIVDISRDGAIVDFRSHRFLLEPR